MNELVLEIVEILNRRIDGLTDIRRVNEEIKLDNLIDQLKDAIDTGGDPSATALQPGDNVSVLTNDAGFITVTEADDKYLLNTTDILVGQLTATSLIKSLSPLAEVQAGPSTVVPTKEYVDTEIAAIAPAGFTGSFATATHTITVANGLITAVTAL